MDSWLPGLGEGEKGRGCFMGMGSPWGDDENVPKLDRGECTKCHRPVPLEWVNFMLYEFCLNKRVEK